MSSDLASGIGILVSQTLVVRRASTRDASVTERWRCELPRGVCRGSFPAGAPAAPAGVSPAGRPRRRREEAAADRAIGTTGRGIGPAYEDKVARRGLRLGDLTDRQKFADSLREVLEYHNHALVHYYGAEALDFDVVLATAYEEGEQLLPMMADVTSRLHDCLLYTSPSPRDLSTSRMPSSA